MWVRLYFFIAILYAAVGSADAQLKYDFICDSLNRIEMNGDFWLTICACATLSPIRSHSKCT